MAHTFPVPWQEGQAPYSQAALPHVPSSRSARYPHPHMGPNSSSILLGRTPIPRHCSHVCSTMVVKILGAVYRRNYAFARILPE